MTFLQTLTPQGRQKLLALLVGGVIVAIVLGVFWMLEEDSSSPEASPSTKTSLTTAHDRLNPQELWVERVENENKLTQNKIEALEKALKAFMQTASSPKDPNPEEDFLPDLKKEAASFEKEVKEADFSAGASLPALPFEADQAAQSVEGAEPSPGIHKVVLKLGPSAPFNKNEAQSEDIENTLPANTYATAVILGGVDASTALQAASDPRPVLLRILDRGSLPRHFKSDLKNCRVSASSYGDLSSERVFMRLEKLTCVERLTGETIQTQVAGYVLGEDGRAGVRGVVADRAGELMRQSLMGGFLSGMSQFFGAQRHAFPASAFPPFTPSKPLPPGQMLGASLSEGTGNALEHYATFFIKRAEQLQPVLQIAAGRKVDIVFTEGTRLGETSVRKVIERVRQESRAKALHAFEEKSMKNQKGRVPLSGENP